MKLKCLYVIFTLGLLFAAAPGIEAACPPDSLRPVVLPGAKTAVLMKSDLGFSSNGVLQWSAPTHGVVTQLSDRLVYSPDASFWDLGVDSIVVAPSGRNDLPKTVQWVAGSLSGPPSVEDFENPWNPNWDLSQFDAYAIGPLGKLSGNYGLHFTAMSFGGEATVHLPQPDTGGATAGGGATASWHPPGGGGGGSNGTCGGAGQGCPAGIWYRLLAADGNDDGTVEYSVYVRENGNLVLVGLSPGGSLLPGETPIAVTSVARAAHQLEMHFWPEGEFRTGGAGLWIDGRLALATETLSPAWRAVDESAHSTYIWNGMPATASLVGANLAHSLDNLAVFDTGGQARFDCLAVDGFDGGSLDPAWVPSNGGNLVVLPGAALVGGQGLDIQLADLGASVGGFLKLPVTGRNRHGLKFRFDPNSPELPAGINLAVGFQSGSTPRPFVATLNRNASGTLVVQVHSNDDSGAPKSTLIPISDAPHVLEFDWQRSQTTYVPSGYLRAWLDGVLVAEHLNLNNDAQSITEIRVGAFGLAGAAKGHLFVDQVEAWGEALPVVE